MAFAGASVLVRVNLVHAQPPRAESSIAVGVALSAWIEATGCGPQRRRGRPQRRRPASRE
jgi:hypothetical protein